MSDSRKRRKNMSKKYEPLAAEIIRLVGGEKNVDTLHHCQTRLRFKLYDEEKADLEGLSGLEGVTAAINKGGMIQVVIGLHVEEVYEEAVKYLDTEKTDTDIKTEEKKKQNPLDIATSFISSIFAPIVPALAGAGMVKALLSILVAFNLVDTNEQTYIIINMISDAAFAFLPILLAYTTAQKLKCNPIMAATVAGILVHGTWNSLVAAEEPVILLGIIPLYLVSYTSSVIPIVLVLLVQAPLERWLNRVMPGAVRLIFVPMITFLVMGVLALGILGPIGAMVGQGLSFVFLWLGENASWAPPLIVGAFFPIMVMFGVHHGVAPVGTMSLMQLGYDAIWGPGIVCSNIAQGAAALAASFVTKDKQTRQVGIPSGITALMGTTEPVLYGVNLPKRYPLIAAMIGGGLGGLFAGVTHTRRYAFGSSGIPAAVMYIGENTLRYFYQIIIALVISAVAAAIFTVLLSRKYEKKNIMLTEGTLAEGAEKGIKEIPAQTEEKELQETGISKLVSPAGGMLVPMEEIADPVFSSGALGFCCGIEPEEGVVFAPVAGEVVQLSDTLHAVGILGENGAEVLIHVGVDTVEMNGDGFTALVKEGDKVATGQKLLTMDLDKIVQAGHAKTVITAVTNSDDFTNIEQTADGMVKAGDEIMELKNE